MKKLLLVAALLLSSLNPAFADDAAANIKIRINGAIHDNTYFLCLPDLGCLSIMAAKKGKIYPVYRNFDMNTIFITDTNDMQVYAQGLPKSCDVAVKTNQTITISGTLTVGADKRAHVQQLRCSVQ